eukprot:CAMPEP_0196656842 /NCGR_PEP_ID=MMETSP1086-20130531/19788_1 /TAXON_ID=77921 /ORGANISM="Cyanoptyche  gloeocystis , Strain SAG4.97" /LENGTH=352 /DNA_ID=CAMNT_0041989729 /DNA_START=72 /DNA_END=1130 /DNA_ORIENTATION=+
MGAQELVSPLIISHKDSDFKGQVRSPLPALEKLSAQSASMSVETFRIIGAVLFYFITSLAVVFLNKFVMNYSDIKFPRPLFITWFQLVVALVCIVLLGELGRKVPGISFLPRFEFSYNKAKAIAPLTVIYVLMLATSNLCLNYVEVTFYQVVRSMNICWNIGLSYFMLSQMISGRVLTSCGVVFIGYVMAAMGEVNFSWLGIFFGLSSSLFVSLNSVYVKKVLPVVNNDTWKLAIYNTVLALVMLFPAVLANGDFSELAASGLMSKKIFWIANIVTGMFGYLINIATFMQIKYTSPLTHTISGTAKAIVQTVLGALIFRNEVSLVNGIGNAVCIGGSAWYALIRHQEMQQGK